jgi:signal transduction histidine kinase
MAFALAITVVLAAAGTFFYLGLRSELTAALDDGLETQAAAVARLLVERGEARPGLTEGLDDPGETFTQVIAEDGRLLSSSPGLPPRPILDAGERRRAAEGATVTLEDVVVDDDEGSEEIDIEALEETGAEPFEEDRARVIARRVDVGGERFSVIVGATFEDRNETLRELMTILLIGLPAALVLACLAGYGAIRGALRPVERMRSRAAAISAAKPGARLPVPEGSDELARLGGTLNEMLDRLEAALERERTFVADASHELRTPIAILRSELEVALQDPKSAESLEAAVRSGVEEAEQLSRIAEGLLLLARSDEGDLPLSREPVELGSLLEDARERFAGRAEDLGRTISVDAPKELVVDGDRQRLDQTVSNLIENALRHGEGHVELTGRRDDGLAVLTVVDHGDGFPPDFIPHAFERFTRAETARTGTGAGLGLAITVAVANAHGGSAEVLNRRGGGAQVVIRLPLARV